MKITTTTGVPSSIFFIPTKSKTISHGGGGVDLKVPSWQIYITHKAESGLDPLV
jgi:hypothetical protein